MEKVGSKDYRRKVGTIRADYFKQVEEFRKPLYNYCLSLTGNAVDAEDLNQETLLKCFARSADLREQDEKVNLRSYHFRAASNIWISQHRKMKPDLDENIQDTAIDDPGPIEKKDIRDLAILVASVLAPVERACFMLRDLFEFSLEETANMLETSVGAVKAALFRARTKLKNANEERCQGSKRVIRASKELVEKFVHALNERSVDLAIEMFAKDSIGDIHNCGYEIGIDAIRKGSMGVTTSYEEFSHAEMVLWKGQPIVILWENREGFEKAEPSDVIIVEESDQKISKMSIYYFCPEFLEELGRDLGLKFIPKGYWEHGRD